MKICLVSQEYPPETAHGGIGTQTYLKAHGLAARGHQLTVISRSCDDQRHVYKDAAVEVIRVPGMEHLLEIGTEVADWLTYSVQVAVELGALASQGGIDLIDVPEWACEGYAYLINRRDEKRVPVIIQLHGPLVLFAQAIGWPALDSEFYRIGRSMEDACLRLADARLSSSECSAQWCAREYGLSREDIRIWHAGVDTTLFSPNPSLRHSRPTIVFVGRVTRDKGVALLVRAAIRLADEVPGLHLSILGRGDDALIHQMQQEAKAAGCDQLLEFGGFIDRQTLPARLRVAHVFAGPSAYEPGPGLVYLEAMACGLPVVACQSAGATEVIQDGQTGLLVPPGDGDALTEALRRLLTQEDLRQTMGRQARQYVESKAESRLCIEQLEQFYQEVLSRAQARRE